MEGASLGVSGGQERGDQGDLRPHVEGATLAETGKAVVVVNHVDHMRYVKGYEPSEAKRTIDPHIGHEM